MLMYEQELEHKRTQQIQEHRDILRYKGTDKRRLRKKYRELAKSGAPNRC